MDGIQPVVAADTEMSQPSTEQTERQKGKKVKSSAISALSGASSAISGTGSSGSALEVAASGEIDLAKAWDDLSAAPDEHYFENGRRYHMYKLGRYPIPNDEVEQNREDMKHGMTLDLTGGKLFFAPISGNLHKILDIGTGTGIWAIDVADEYPDADVLGTDLSAIQPDYVPPNVRFLIDDVEEEEWLNGSNWDLIHFRMVAGSLRDVQGAVDRCFENIRPGGWIEFQELHVTPQCDDDSMKEGDFLKNFYELVFNAFEEIGMDHNRPRMMKRYLQQAGFTNIKCVVKKTPIGPWAKGHHLQRIGSCMKYAILDLLPSFLKPLQAIEVSRVEAEVWFMKVRQTLEDNSIHRYLNFYFWYGQKPENHQEPNDASDELNSLQFPVLAEHPEHPEHPIEQPEQPSTRSDQANEQPVQTNGPLFEQPEHEDQLLQQPGEPIEQPRRLEQPLPPSSGPE